MKAVEPKSILKFRPVQFSGFGVIFKHDDYW